MSLSNAVIDAMLAAGCTAAQLAAAMKAANDDAAIVKTSRRCNDAERQRKSRANRGLSQNVTVTECDIPSPLCPPFDKEIPPTPPKEIKSPPISPQPFPRLAFAEPELWADFLKNRKTKRLPSTATAHERLCRDLAAMAKQTGLTESQVFRACVEKGWGAIYDPTGGGMQQSASPPPESHRNFMTRQYADKPKVFQVQAIE